MSGPGYSTNGVSGYSHSMTPAGMRETAARNVAAREAAARNVAAREAAAAEREAEAAANKNKVRAPLNFWLRANGVRVMSADVEDNKSYVLLVTNFETNSDDVFKVTKIGDMLYKVGKYSTGRNNEILYERMVQELVEGAAELYKVPDSLQSGSGRKSRRNRRKSRRSRKSRSHK